MEKEGQKSSGLSRLSLACLLLVALQNGNPKDWQALSKLFQLIKILVKLFVVASSIMSMHDKLPVLQIWDLHHNKI